MSLFIHSGLDTMDEGEGEKTSESEPVPHTQPLCRFFSQGRHCNFGKRCRFLHIRDDARAHKEKTTGTPSQSDVTLSNSEIPGGNVGYRVAPAAGHRPCRYFLSGHCTMEDRCRFWHPPQLPPLDDQPVPGNYSRSAPRIQPVPRPGILQDVKLCDLTEDLAKQLRDTEIRQLKKRFPKEQLIIQERSDGKVTYYRASVAATDPDWVNISCYFRSPLLRALSSNPPTYYSYYKLQLSFEAWSLSIDCIAEHTVISLWYNYY